jgi:hypothetical protein
MQKRKQIIIKMRIFDNKRQYFYNSRDRFGNPFIYRIAYRRVYLFYRSNCPAQGMKCKKESSKGIDFKRIFLLRYAAHGCALSFRF